MAILNYWTDFPSGWEPVKWVPLDLSSDGVHLIGSPPEEKSVQYIRRFYIYFPILILLENNYNQSFYTIKFFNLLWIQFIITLLI